MDRPRKSLKILWLEDSDPDYELAREILDADGLAAEFIRVTRRKDFQAALRRERFDAVISDFALPDYDGGSALVTARQIQPDIPFVLLSGAVGEERAVEFLKSGATDCVLKNNLARLAPVIRRALAEAQERRRRRHAEEALRGRTQELQALAGRLLAGREEERIRISREIHDELGEALTAQKIGLAWIRNRLQTSRSAGPEIFDRIEKLGQLADATAHRVRKLCTELRPSILDDLGLLAAIEWQAKQFEVRSSIECRLLCPLKNLHVRAEVATALFRIFQEILTNVARHSGASRVAVTLKTAGKRLVLQVADNGKGVSEDQLRGGTSLGILGMRERAALVGGKFEIHGKPGRGTTVTVAIPCA